MYAIRFNNFAIYDPTDERYIVRDPSVHLAVGEAGNLSFTIENDHPNIAQLTKLKGNLELLQDTTVIYRGRIIRDEKDFYNSRRVETEGLLAALNDSIIPPFNFPEDFVGDPAYQSAATSGNVVAYLLGWFISQHNSQVTSDRQIQLGNVTVTDSNNYLSCSTSEHASTWQMINDKLTSSALGGYILPRYEANGTYIDYVADFSLTNTQPVVFAKNLLDILTDVSATDLYTAIMPIGADGLTIASEPDGALTSDLVKSGKIIYSTSARATYGNITRVVKWDGVTVASRLKSKGAAKLAAEGVMLTGSIEVTAADIPDIGETSFRVGRYVRLTSTPHGMAQNFALLELEPDILNPANTSIKLSAIIQSQTDINKAERTAVGKELDRHQIELNTQQNEINNLATSTTRQITEAVQTSREIIFTALRDYVQTGDFTTYQETVSSQLQILADNITVSVNQVTTQITDVNNDLQQQIRDITKYFRFTADGLYIGETGNDILLRLDNDIIEFIKNNLAELWIDTDGVHASSVVASRVQIGNFEFAAEPDGRLSLRKAGT